VSVLGIVILTAFLGGPVVALAHELGHAAVALRFTRGPVAVRVGRTDVAVKGWVRRLYITFSPIGVGGGCLGPKRGELTRGQALAYALAGPAVNLILTIMLWSVGRVTVGAARPVLFTLAAVSGLYLVNLIPHRDSSNLITRGQPSDGMQAVYLLRNRPLPPPASPRTRGGLRDRAGRDQLGLFLVGVLGATIVVIALARLAGPNLGRPLLAITLTLYLHQILARARPSAAVEQALPAWSSTTAPAQVARLRYRGFTQTAALSPRRSPDGPGNQTTTSA
jgi:hypothetical protein